MDYLIGLFPDLPIIPNLPLSFQYLIGGAICAAVAIAVIAVVALVAVWFERKISAHMQCRLGPMLVGWHGVLQTAADGIKLFLKEDIIPAMADKWLFIMAPAVVLSGAILSWAVLPLGPGWVPADLNVGLLYMLATSSVVAIGIIMAGWASHNKWSLYGAMRTSAQFLSYEIPTALHVIPPILIAGSLNLGQIVDSQAGGLLGMSNWNVFGGAFHNPFLVVAFVCYYVSSLAEANRLPFDLPESESEIVAGFHTEYSAMRFSFFFIAEYADLFVVSALGVLLFMGGWHGPFGSNAVMYFLKVSLLIFIAMWLRWTLPRLRIDQLMSTCWKFLIPVGLVNLLLASLWMALAGNVG